MNITLRPDKSLIDSNFESYKLSLTKIPIYYSSINRGVHQKILTGNALSKQQLKAFSAYNCLIQDPFDCEHIYIVNSDGEIVRYTIPSVASSIQTDAVVFKIPTSDSVTDGTKWPSATMKFISKFNSLLYDGAQNLYLLGKAGVNWQAQAVLVPPILHGETQLVDATSYDQDGKFCFDCALVSVVDSKKHHIDLPKMKTTVVTLLDWLSYSRDGDSYWQLQRQRRFVASAYPDFVAFEEGASALHICAEHPFLPIMDSQRPNESTAELPGGCGGILYGSGDAFEASSETPTEVGTSSRIRWSHSSGHKDEADNLLTITFHMPSCVVLPCGETHNISKLVSITVVTEMVGEETKQRLVVKYFPTEQAAEKEVTTHSKPLPQNIVLLDALLFGMIKPETKWTMDLKANSIDVHLWTADDTKWLRLLNDPKCDRKLIDSDCSVPMSASFVENAQTGPMATADNVSEPAPKSAFNVEQLEEVDFVQDGDEEDLSLQRIESGSMHVTHQAFLSGHQFLFNIPVEQTSSHTRLSTSAVCLRHDVDGIIWLPTPVANTEDGEDAVVWRHTSALQAFGYVLASKQDRRFVACPPVHVSTVKATRFVAVADNTRRIYVYWQPLPPNSASPTMGSDPHTELRKRRKTNDADTDGGDAGIVHLAWQHVVSLPDSAQILGFAAVDHPIPACIVCTQERLYLLALNS